MDTEANKALVERFVDEVYSQLSAEAVDELVADDFHAHSLGADGMDKDGLRAATERMGQALSDIRFTIQDLIAEEDRVCVRLTAGARQTGEFMGMPATGNSYEIEEIHIFRIEDGRIAEHWHQLDAMGMMKQLKGDD